MGYIIALTRWSFTWFLAALPALLHMLNVSTNGETILLEEICGKGELFIISIVMVAEPLSALIFSKHRGEHRYIFFVFAFIFLAAAIGLFSNVDSNPQFAKICSPKNENIVYPNIQLNFMCKCDTNHENKFSNKYIFDTSKYLFDTTIIENGRFQNIEINNKHTETVKKRLQSFSFGTLIAAFIFGVTLVIYKQRNENNFSGHL